MKKSGEKEEKVKIERTCTRSIPGCNPSLPLPPPHNPFQCRPTTSFLPPTYTVLVYLLLSPTSLPLFFLSSLSSIYFSFSLSFFFSLFISCARARSRKSACKHTHASTRTFTFSFLKYISPDKIKRIRQKITKRKCIYIKHRNKREGGEGKKTDRGKKRRKNYLHLFPAISYRAT